jgi:hypothetical protein
MKTFQDNNMLILVNLKLIMATPILINEFF